MWPGSAATPNSGAYTTLPVLATEEEDVSASALALKGAAGKASQAAGDARHDGWEC